MSVIYETICENVNKNKDKYALISKSYYITYGDLNSKVNMLIELFQKKGIDSSSKVIIGIENKVDYLTVFIALNACNATIIPLYIKTGEEKKNRIIKDMKPNFIITDEEKKMILIR